MNTSSFSLGGFGVSSPRPGSSPRSIPVRKWLGLSLLLVGCTATTSAEDISKTFDRKTTSIGFVLQERGDRRAPRSLEYRFDETLAPDQAIPPPKRRGETRYIVSSFEGGSGGTEFELRAYDTGRSMVAREQRETGEPSFRWAWSLWDSRPVQPPTGADATQRKPKPEPEAEPSPSPEPECTRDEDCALSCYTETSCCPAPCWCNNPVPKSRLEPIRKAARKICLSGKMAQACPQVSCAQRAFDDVPFCNAKGKCDTKQVPPIANP
ncbi:MAG: hypothetical protein AAFQ82_24785 [Myxococcota bacterium]